MSYVDKKDISLLRTALNIRCEPSESRRKTERCWEFLSWS